MADDTINTSVQTEILQAHGAASPGVGRLCLNQPKSLNALTLEMIKSSLQILQAWATDPRVACVVIEGAGDKAFCAGGDVRKLQEGIVQTHASRAQVLAACQEFFAHEYRLDFTIHTFPKPVIIWGHGFVMGGGLGLMVGGSHRLVTEKTQVAMPEVAIGLYPDVGASYFLTRMPSKLGLFLGLTGARVNAADAIFLDLADIFVPSDRKSALLAALRAIRWSSADQAYRLVTEAIQPLAETPSVSPIRSRSAAIEKLMSGSNVQAIVQQVLEFSAEPGDAWFAAAQEALRRGSPTSLALTYEQFQRSGGISRGDAFRQEMILSLQCCLAPDFQEGVRALLVDKDQAPQWQPATLSAVKPGTIGSYFQAPWTGREHPLADLVEPLRDRQNF